MNGDDGAVTGRHRVTITTYEAEVDRAREWMKVIRQEEIPGKYREPGALEFEVPAEGTEQADFSLDSKA